MNVITNEQEYKRFKFTYFIHARLFLLVTKVTT
jgi:hypothetical protein